MRGQSLLERFEQKYIPEPNSGCWLWTAAVWGRDGRGCIGVGYANGRSIVVAAHRVSWELFCSPIPDGMSVLHSCDMPLCVNPDHLWLGTQDENMKDCARKGRIVTNPLIGGAVKTAKLTEEQVREIRTKSLHRDDYARKFGIAPTYVNAVQRGESWKHLNARQA